MDTSRFLEEVRMFLSIYNRSLVNTWGFVPMSKGEVDHMAAGLRHLIVPELAMVTEVDGQVVGAMFGLPDYNPRIRQIDGRLFPTGLFRLLLRKDRIKRIRLISTNVIPEYQRLGLGLVLMSGIVPKVLASGVQEAEFSWVLESNSLSRGALQKGGAKLTKTYRIYDLDQPPGAERWQPKTASLVRPAAAAAPRPLEIRPVQTRRDLRQFIQVPRADLCRRSALGAAAGDAK